MAIPIPSVVPQICLGAALAVVSLSVVAEWRRTKGKSQGPGYRVLDATEEEVYADEDGQATEKSMLKARDIPQRLLLTTSATVLLVLGVVNVILGPYHGLQQYLLLAAWSVIFVHALYISRSASTHNRFRAGLVNGLAAALVLIAVVLDLISRNRSHTSWRLQLVAVAISCCHSCLAVSFHRRPNLYQDGRLIDEQYSATVLSRFFFAWAAHLNSIARHQTILNEKDLPLLDHQSLTASLYGRITARPGAQQSSLWYLILLEHWRSFALQWSVALVEAVAMFGPEIALFNLLKTLEQRESGRVTSEGEVYFWIAMLAIAGQIHLRALDSLEWIKWATIELQVRAQLTALIFSKAMRLSNIKDAIDPSASTLDESKTMGDASETSPLLPKRAGTQSLNDNSDDKGSDDGEDEDEEKAHKGAISLIEVDAETVSAYCAEGSEVMANLVKLLIGGAFLVTVLGWKSTLAGLAVPLFFAPVTKSLTSTYTKAQDKASSARDRKTNVVTEALHGMRQIKFAALEAQWRHLIMAARNQELVKIKLVWFWRIILTVIWLAVPILLGAVALTTYTLTEGQLSAAVAFTALAVFQSLASSLSYLPVLVADLSDAYVSLSRISIYLRQDEKEAYLSQGATIKLKDASLSWPSQQEKADDDGSSLESPANRFVLSGLDLEFPTNALSIILGDTGSGKSLLLAGITGEARLLAGSVAVPQPTSYDTIDSSSSPTGSSWVIPSMQAYVAQIPWIENASVRDNILFGLPMERSRYDEVIRACALQADLESLIDNDSTEIGANGVGLSGGQKWRLTLARALYSRAGILIMDDIFSAVDSHVGRHLLENALLGPLAQNRTIILATHHADLARSAARYVVQLHDHRATATVQASSIHRAEHVSDKMSFEERQEKPEEPTLKQARKFVEDEERAQGQVSFSVYKAYVEASGGWLFWTLLLLIFFMSNISSLATSFWVKSFTESQSRSGPPADNGLNRFIYVYIGLSAFHIVLIATQMIVLRTGALHAARKLFFDITESVLSAQLRWIDTVPTGRILNRFVGDFADTDHSVARYIAWFFDSVFTLTTILIAALLASPMTLLIIIPFFLASGYIARVYLRTARDLKRLESVSSSPILDTIGTSLQGLSTIRVFDKVRSYEAKMHALVDTQCRASYHLHLLNCWMESRMGLFGSVFQVCIAIFVATKRDISASMAGFVLSFALQFSEYILFAVSEYSHLELDMNAVERIVEYMDIPHETLNGDTAPASWPTGGKIEVSGLKVSYAPDLPPAIKDISFVVNPGERIGVVGRTGSGKSSLTLSLFRFLEPIAGRISVDDIDISTIKLPDLRLRMSIIPQDPVLFTGTIRSNLDPFHKHTDASLLDALRRANLITDAGDSGQAFSDLGTAVAQSGLNFSQGERQLICLARALVTRSKIMILDEATSAVDMKTDALIQQSIREGFVNSTLLVIAHRLSTIIDFDRILVMGDGEVLEYGRPCELFESGGAFAKMVNDSSEKDALIHAMQSS